MPSGSSDGCAAAADALAMMNAKAERIIQRLSMRMGDRICHAGHTGSLSLRERAGVREAARAESCLVESSFVLR